jgi:hypothetical protein
MFDSIRPGSRSLKAAALKRYGPPGVFIIIDDALANVRY